MMSYILEPIKYQKNRHGINDIEMSDSNKEYLHISIYYRLFEENI